MANKKIQATATLFLDTKDAQNDAKQFVNDLKRKLSEVETAADKMSVFKDMVAYIAQVDRALSALRKNNKDAFNSMFDGLDINLKQQLEGLFGVNGAQLGQVDTLREKLNTLTLKSSIKEIRTFAKEINTLFSSIGVSTPFDNIDKQFSGRTNTGHIQALATALANFATVWEDLSANIAKGLGVGGSSGSGGVFGGLNKEVQQEIDRLKKQKQEFQDTIDAINGEDIKINVTTENDAAELKKLIESYREIQKQTISSDFNKMSFDEQNKLLAERVRLATLLKKTSDYVIDNGGSDEAFDMATSGDGMRAIENAERFLDDFHSGMQHKADQIKATFADLIANIDVQLNQLSIDSLNLEPTKQSILSAIELMNEANRIMGEISFDSPNNDLLDAQLDSLIEKIKQLATTEEQVMQLDELLGDYRDAPDDALEEICNILEVNIPRGAEKAKEAIDSIVGGNNQPSKQNISILAKQLQEIYNLGRQIGDNEIGFAVDVDGAAYFVQSADHMVKVADEASVAVRALNDSLTILGHTHPNGGGLFSAGDYRSAISQKRSGMNMPVVAVGSNAASVLNLDGVDETTLDQIERVLDKFKNSDDAVGPSAVKELQNILSTNGFTDALQVIDISNGMDELSETLLRLSMNATEVQTPLQKLQSLIHYYSGNKLGADAISRFANEWKAFESGAKSASEVFDSVMYKLDATDLEGNYFKTSEKEYENLSTSLNMIKPSVDTAINSLSEAENKLKSFFEFADKMQHENLYGSAENNVDIGRYIERLETAKAELEELGAQGIITAEDLEKVNLAFTEATVHLEAETSHYDSYYSGPSYDYYDDYKQEQSKNGDLENELTRKDERIAELESDLRESDEALQETLGNKYALIAESRTLEIERAKLLLQKQNLEYEDILALMQSYQNLQAKAKDAFDYGDEKAMYDMQELAGQIYDRVVPQNLDDFTEPDRWFKAVGSSAEEGAQKLLELRERLDALHSSHDDLELSDSEDIGDLQRENGALQDKLDLLNEIASVYGSNITQKDRSRYEELTYKEMESGLTSKEESRLSDLSDKIYEADSALEELGNTYDKIILKLANGKKVEILPDDAGLRSLHKFEDEGYGETYGGIDVEDVVFVRKQEQSVIEQTNQELQEHLNLQKHINQESKKDVHVDAIDQEPVADDVSSGLVESQEIAQLDALQQKLLEVKAAVDAKTQAFESEFATVNNVVDSEIMALQSLIGQLQEVVAQINLINDGFNSINTNVPKIELKSAPSEPYVATENTHYVTDPQGRPVNAYRGIEGAYSGLVSNRYHGGTFWTTNIELAKEYAGEIGKVEKSLLSMKNPMEIDGHGAYWNQIEYIGDNSDEASQKLHQLNATIKQTEEILEHLRTIKPTEKELKNLNRGLISETQNEREIREYTAVLEKAKAERDAIFADSKNPYGKKNTNEIVEIAKSKGYDGVIFKDIIDSATGSVTDLSTVMVTFEQNQIHYIETISSTFESSVAALKSHFGDLTQHISASSEEVESSIRKMVELGGKLKTGEITEDEYNAFISGNAIARDYEQLARQSKAVPDFITGALDGNEFELKHVIQSINGMIDNMRERMQNIAKAFGKEGMSLDQLLTDNINDTPVADSSSGKTDIAGEVEQLDKLQAVLTEVKNAVLAKTKAFADEGNVVGQAVGKEIAALMKLSGIIDGIVPKVNALVDGLKSLKDHGVTIKDSDTNNVGSDDSKTTGGTKDAPPEDPFAKKLRSQTNTFNEYRDGLKDVQYVSASLRDELNKLGAELHGIQNQSDLSDWINNFNALKDNIEAAKSVFDQENYGKINLYQRELTNSFNKLTLPQREELFNEYSEAIILLNKQKQSVKDGHAVELAGIKQITAALQEKIDAQIQANKVAKDTEKVQKKNANFGSTVSINATAKYNSLSKIAGSDQFATSSEVTNILAQYTQAYENMIAMRDRLRSSDYISDGDKEGFKTLTTECNNYAKSLEKLINATLKFKGTKANQDDYMLGEDFEYSNVENRKAALADFVKQMYGVDVAAENFKNNWNEVVFAVDNGDGTFTQMTATFTAARNEIVAMAGDTKKAQGALANFWDELKGKFKSIGAYLVASVSFYEVWSVIRQGITYVRDIDSALTELKKVTNETDASYAQFLQDMSKTGSVIGATVADLTTMASEWARLGYSMEEAGKLAESTAILLNVSEFDDATQASEALISTMQAFQYTADESGHVVDVLNEVGNNFAVSSDGIATALQDSASALMEAGNNLEQSVALVAAANKVVQDPNSVGSALRTISLRLRGTSVEILEEMGEETDGVVESVSKMQEKIEALTGVDILTNTGDYKETYQILYEIGQVWEDMNDIDQAALLELMAGKNRANTLAAILGNMEDLEGAYQSALNAEGSAMRENEAYLDSIQGRIDLFNNAIQTMWMNFIDSEVVKFIVDLGTGFIQLADNVGILKIALAGLLTYFNASSKYKLDFASMLGLTDTNKISSQVSEFTSVLSTIKNTKLSIDPEINVVEILDGMSAAAQNGQQSLINYTASLGPGTDALKAYAASVQDGNYSMAGFQQFITQHNASLKASGVAAKAAAIGHQLLNAALSMGVALIASFAIDTIVKGFDALITTNSELIQQADELQNAYASQSKTIQGNLSTLQELGTEFNQLSRGVDDYGNNISLAANDYERYQSIVESIVGISPSLIEGYDAEGNAIANKNGLLAESIRLMQEEQRLNAQKLVSDDNLEIISGSVQAKLEEYKKENRLPYGSAKSNFMTEFAKAISDDDNYDVFEALNPDNYIWSDYSGAGADSIYAQNFASDFYDTIVADLRSEESKLESYFTEEQRQNMLDYAYEYEKNVQAYNHDIESINNELNSTLQTVPLAETSYYTLSDEMKGYLTQYINDLDVTADNLLDKKQDIIDLTKIIANNKDVQSALSSAFTLKMGLDKDGKTLNYKDYQEEVSKIIQEIDKFDYTDEQKKIIFDFIGLDVESQEFDNKISEAATHARNLLQDRFDAHVGDLSISDILITTKITEDPNSLTFDELEARIEKIKIASTEDFDITKYTKTIAAHSAVITEYQEALQKLGKGSFTMDDFVALVEKYPDLAKGVDISSNAFYGLSRNLNRAIKSNTKSFIKDLKGLKKELEAAGKSTDVIDQLVEAIENMPDDALADTIQRYGTLADEIERAKLNQDQLIASMEENPNEGYETRGEAMEYMKESMKRGEIGSKSNLWNVAERYGFTYDSAKTINENADALANYIAVRDTWYKQDDDGNYTYEGTENFIEAVEKVVDANDDLAKILEWNYDESTGVFNFDFNNENLPEIISLLGQTKELIGLTEQEWSDMMVQVGQYFGIDWSNYQDAKDHLDEIANSTSDAKTKVEEYGKAMQDYFGAETSIDLTKRPMVSKEAMQSAGWSEFDGEYATLFSGGYSNADDTVAVTVTPILPDGEVLGPGALAEYANQLAEGMEPAELKFTFNGKEYTGEDIFLKKTVGKDASTIDNDYGLKLSEAQAQYDQLRDSLNINTTINESGIEGLRKISELQDSIKEKSDGTVVINEDTFRSALVEAEYTEDQIDLLVEKIKSVNDNAFNFDSLNLDDAMLNKGIDGLKEVIELQSAIREDTKTGLTVVSTDMFASILDGAGYSKEQIDALIQKIQEYNDVVAVSGSADPLGLDALNGQIDPLRAALNTLDIEYSETIGKWGDGLTDIKINVPDLVSTLKANNWTDEAIKAYCAQLSETNIEGFQVKVDPTEVDAAIAKANEIPEEESTEYSVTGDGYATVQGINNEWAQTPTEYSTEYTIYENTVKTTEESDKGGFNLFKPSTWFGTGADGTAHATGSWGAPKTETALVGELGPELLVRNGRWTTIGDNGAEFTQVRKGDIIFNHKQTEDLLSKGYVTGRGKLHGGLSAFASGTALASGGGTFGRYEFDGKGSWTEYDVNNKIVDSMDGATSALSEAADALSDSSEEFSEVFDWIEVRIEELDETLALLESQIESATYYNEKNTIIDDLINTNKTKLDNLEAGYKKYADYAAELLTKVPEEYRDAVQNGAIEIEAFVGEADETTLTAIQNYREWSQKAADYKQQANEIITTIRDLAIQKFDNAYEAGDVRATVEDSQTEKLQNAVDYDETRGLITSDAYYIAMMENSNKKIEYLTDARVAMQKELDAAVKAGQIERGSNEWYELLDQMYQVDAQIDEATIELEEFQNAINDIYWENFDQLISRIDYIKDETQSLIDLMSNDKLVADPVKRKYKNGTVEYWTADDVDWTDEGLASLGLYAQQMEAAEYKSKQYAEAIDDLTKEYEAGHYSENEYLEKLNELKDGQYESIEAYYDARDAIKDLNEARIDSIKEGIEKEIEAYEELVEAKKEALDAEKDAYDFQKSVMEQQKDISDVERKLAALTYDNSASARAQRAKLEAELAELKSELDETYYERSIEEQQNALDKELENFQEEKEAEITKWEEYLDNVEQVVTDSLGIVQANATEIGETLTSKAQEYNLTVSDAILTPWQDGSLAVSDYQDTFGNAASSTIDQLDAIKAKWQEVIDKMVEAGNVDVSNINQENADYASATYQKPKEESPKKPKKDKEEESSKEITEKDYYGVALATLHGNYGWGNGADRMKQYKEKGLDYDKVQGIINKIWGEGRIHNGTWEGKYHGLTKKDLKKYHYNKFAHGTNGVTKDQLAIIDELGDELQLVPDGNGRLAYLTKGTSVIPADMTANLMEWGALDPADMLERNRPQIGASPSVIHNNTEVHIDASVGELLHVEHLDGNNPAEITKIVDKAWDKRMKELNGYIRRYANR